MSQSPSQPELLSMHGVCITVSTKRGTAQAVRGVDLGVSCGETLAIVGESGSGKSLTALSILGLLPRGVARVVSGEIRFDGMDLALADETELDKVRGARIGMIFQEPLSALNPVMRIGAQLIEALRSHAAVDHAEAKRRALQALVDVRIADPARRLRQYPHELSGGMRQRVMIAMALIAEPALLIADEPTTALDVTIQAQILDLLQMLQARRGLAMILITHDLGIVASVADRVAVMYAGEIVESGPVARILAHPAHPYTLGLLSCLPEFGLENRRLNVIEGSIPGLLEATSGCRFRVRCPLYRPGACDREVPLTALASDHACRCTRPVGADGGSLAGEAVARC